jgi:hypothetical protein
MTDSVEVEFEEQEDTLKRSLYDISDWARNIRN